MTSAKSKENWNEKTPFFVYGTLRPDADRSVHWCKWWNEPKNCRLRSRKGYVKKCKLMMGDYPFILMNDQIKREKGKNWKDSISFGWIQDFYPVVDRKLYNKKLRKLDEVEGYPDFYKRCVVDAYYCSDFDKDKITGKERKVKVHVYYMNEDCFEKSVSIPSGDFLKFKKKKKKRKRISKK